MHPRPTYDDANLILRLYEMRREARMRQARAWFTSKCKGVQSFEELMKLAPPGSDENASFRQVVTYWDLVASFIAACFAHAGPRHSRGPTGSRAAERPSPSS